MCVEVGLASLQATKTSPASYPTLQDFVTAVYSTVTVTVTGQRVADGEATQADDMQERAETTIQRAP